MITLIREFKYADSVVKYLIDRYGRVNKHSMQDEIKLAESICKDHSKDEILMMKRRLEATISARRDTSYINNNPFSLLGLLFTVITTLLITFASIGISSNTMILDKYIDINKIENNNELSQIISNFDLTGVFDVSLNIILIVFFIVLVGTYFIDRFLKKPINKLYHYSILVEEALKLKEREE
mgnify:CR=1 FL=1